MDGNQFDQVTRALGRGLTRREVARLVAGGAVALLGLGRATPAAATGDRRHEHGDVLICHRERNRFKKLAVTKSVARKHLREHDDDFLYRECCNDRDCPDPRDPCARAVCRRGACIEKPGHAGDVCGEPIDGCSPAPMCERGSAVCPPAFSACADNETCIDGACMPACTPICDSRACGDDGCGGSCGSCAANEACDAGSCVCVPGCDGRVCGDDGCGGSCGSCGADESCEDGVCVCVPACGNRVCGDDGCGGSCGACADGDRCEGGLCVPVCQPNCGGRTCGDDGCGGSCGACSGTELCCDGTCVDSNRSDHCGACGNVCASGERCDAGICDAWVPGACSSGDDPVSGANWVVCRADERSAWVAGAERGRFHAEAICRQLGYTAVDAFGGTCGQVCGSCETVTPSCASPGRERFNGTGSCGADEHGAILCFNVHWRCVP